MSKFYFVNRFAKELVMCCLLLACAGTTHAQTQYIQRIYAGTTAGYSGDGGPATAAQINGQGNISFDGSGNLYIADFSNSRIRKVSTSGIITTIGGGGTTYTNGAAATAVPISSPYSLRSDFAGNVYISDGSAGKIYKISTSGIITTGAGGGSTLGDGGQATAAKIGSPRGLALDASGNIYVCDLNATGSGHRVRFINMTTGIITTFAGTGTTGNAGDGGPATAATLTSPIGIDIDAAGNVYISDANNRIRKVITSGIISHFAGSGASLGDGGPASAAKLVNITNLVCDSNGNMFVSDFAQQRVRKIDMTTGIIVTVAGNGTNTSAAAGSPGTASISSPYDICPLGANLFISETGSCKVKCLEARPTIAINISSGTTVVCSGQVYVGGYVDSFTNNGTYIDSTGSFLSFYGMTTQGSGTTTFNKLQINSNAAATSTYNARVSVRDSVNIISGAVNAGAGNIWVRSDLDTAKIVVAGVLTGTVQGVVAYANVASGSSTYTSTLTNNYFGTVAKYQWQTSPDSTTWTSVAGATASVYVATVTATRYIRCNLKSSSSTTYSNFTQGVKLELISVPPITGTLSICESATATLSNTTTGGTWTSANTSVATIDPTTGIYTGLAGGTSSITYATSGGSVTTTVTIIPAPGAIAGTTGVCAGAALTLSDAATGGTWSSANTSVATIGSANGVVSASSAGSAVISYSTGCGTDVTTTLVVSTTPSAISGVNSFCEAATTTLSDVDGGGVWSSSNTGIATVGSASGIVSGASDGTVTITYTTACGSTTRAMTVNPLPGAISGSFGLCASSSATLSNSVAGGTWSSSITTVATVGSSSGILTGVSGGTASITYTLGCGNTVATATVSPGPASISGTATLCQSATTSLSSTTPGGTWTSSNTATATVNASGVVTGVAGGVSTITYSNGCGTDVTQVVSVTPTPGSISGVLAFCASGTSTLTNTIAGGTWSSSNTLIATVNGSSGVLTGVSGGTVNISYSTGCGTDAVQTVTVSNGPTAITGAYRNICLATTVTLSDGVSGGTWSSSNTSRATVNASTGVVLGISSGSSTITYTQSGCTALYAMTVSAPQTPLGIPSSGVQVCNGGTLTISDAIPMGNWSTNNPAIATVSVIPTSSGPAMAYITGLSQGAFVLTYSCGSTGSIRTVSVTNGATSPIAGTTHVLCTGNTMTLSTSGSVFNGLWSSSSTAVATIGSANAAVAGVAQGTTNLSYGNVCGSVLWTTSVATAPVAIAGSAVVCPGTTSTLSNSSLYGTWTSDNPLIAAVGSTDGVVTGVSNGTTDITYSTGCGTDVAITATVTTGASATLSGATALCEAATTTLSSSVSGGIWTSSNSSVATVGSASGVVTGTGGGSVTISYTAGCTGAAQSMTVTPLPDIITGTFNICTLSPTTLSNSSTGGTWSSSNTALATVGSTGIVTGISGGNPNITYSTGCGVDAVQSVTVTPVPGSISGNAAICLSTTTTLSNSSLGGVWSSSNSTVATVGTSGVVSGLAAGTTTISYATGCGTAATKVATVTASPGTISGTATLCATATTTLSNPATGGIWSSSNTTVATIGSTGIVSGLSGGTSTITYSTGCGSDASKVVTVTPGPASITGTATICQSTSTTLSNASLGGVWSSSNSAVATVGTSGIVNGVTGGIATITYSTGCGSGATQAVTVTPNPGSITGTATLCATATTTLSNPSAGGIWTSSNTTVATIGSTGIVSGLSGGTSTITYSTGCGSDASKVVTVTPGPASITGTASICQSTSTTLSNASLGGLWSSSNSAIATVGSTGIVNGVTGGIATITYSTGCGSGATQAVTVTPVPGTINGTAIVCATSTSTLSNVASGGFWNSSNTAVATVNAASGVVLGISGGTSVITYATGCGTDATRTFTVIPGPTSITGSSVLCQSTTTTLSNPSLGGTWTSSNSATATIGSANGVVSGVAGGTTTISYNTGCGSPASLTVSVTPNPSSINGTAIVCETSTTTLSNIAQGGVWSSSNTSIATINSASGVMLGIAGGTANITYSTGCGTDATRTATIIPGPHSITGATAVCQSATTTLSNSSLGGVWSSSNTSNATVGSSNGVVSGIASGPTTISYNTGCGAPVTFVMTVNPTPTVAAITSQTVCNTASTSAITFSGSVSGTSFDWVNNATSIGLAGSGSGNIAGFTTTNSSNALVTGTITVTPNANSCAGSPQTFTIGVNPTPIVSAITSQTVCNTAATGAVAFTSSVSSSINNWTNTTTSIGLAASGSGNIASFTASNSTSAIVTSTITVTPTANSCVGSPVAFNITVNPTPTVAAVTSQTVCNTSATTAVAFSGAVSGSAFNWTNSNTAIGLAASGSGNIASFTATNATSAPVTATVTVTPSANSCSGTSSSFTILVNPTPTVATVGNQTYCNTQSASGTTFSGTVSGTTYTWSNNNSAIGLASSGSGNIASWSASNTTSATIAGTVTVTPAANSCIGSSQSFTVTVNPTPTVAAITSQTVCNTFSTAAVAFTGAVSGTTYNWTNSLSSIGLASSGSGNIASFTGANSTNALNTGTVSVTPVANSCTGSSQSFTIGVYPTPTVTAVSPQTYCNTATTSGVTFAASVSGTSFNWTNNTTSIGLASSGSGNIASWSASNTTSATITGTVTVTPTANTCMGSPVDFTITVNPTPTVAAVTSQTVCNTGSTSAITYSGAVSGTTYNWTNSLSSIGLATSGSGNIAAFTAANSTSAIVTSSITVTPVANSCTGSSQNFTITVNPTPTVNSIANQAFCNTATASGVTFGGPVSGTNYTWTNTASSIGLATSGTGNIASFTATNSTSAPVTAILSVTPDANGCTGPVRSFSITVNPTPDVAAVSNQAFCNALPTSVIPFSGTVSGTLYSWTNGPSSIGLATTGTGNIASFSATNATTAPVTNTVTVTPSANSCTGSSQSFTITINPTPTVTSVADQTRCSGFSTTAVAFASPVSGTTYTWTNSLSSVGLASTGSGNIASFTASNTNLVQVTASVTVTPLANSCTGPDQHFSYIVNPLPTPINGTNIVCELATTTLTDGITGGTWVSTNSSLATIGSSNGVVSGVSQGIVGITYTLPTGCLNNTTVQVNPLPHAGPIAGASSVAVGYTITLSDPLPLGVWTSTSTSVATIGSSSAIVFGSSTGTSTISYTVVNSCGTDVATKTMTVIPAPTIWYSNTSGGDAANLNDWWEINTNSGLHPLNYTLPGITWVFQSTMNTSVAPFSLNGNVNIVTGGNFTAPAGSLSIAGNWSNIGGIFNHNNGTVNMNGAASGITLSGAMTGSNKFNNLNFNGSGSWTFAANAADVNGSFTTTSGTVTAPSTTLQVAGDWVNNATFNNNNGTVELNGAVAQNLGGSNSTAFNILTVNNGAGVTVGTATTFNSGATLNLQNGVLTNTAANLVMSSGSNLFRDNGSLAATPSTYTGVNLSYTNLGFNQLALTTANEFPASFTGNVVVNHSGATITLNGAKALSGPMTLTAGALDASSSNYSLSLTGDWTNNSGTSAFVPRLATVTMNGTSAQALAGSFGTSFNILTINNGAGVTVTPTTTFISGTTLNLQNGAFTNTSSNLVMNSGSNVVRDNGSLGATPSAYSGVNLTYGNLGFNQAALTTGNEFPASFTGNVVVNHSGATVTLNGNKALTGPLTLTAGILDASSANYNIALTGDWTNNAGATAFTPRSGIVTMNGSAAQALAGTFGTNFNVLTINNGAGVTVTPSTTFVSGATLNLQNGAFTNTASNLVMNSGSNLLRDNGTLAVTPSAYSGINLTYANLGFNQATLTTANEFPASFTGNVVVNHTGATISLDGSKTLNGPLTLTSGVLDASASNYNISLTGNWTNNASATAFTPRSATVTMNGTSAQALAGTFGTNFNILTINNAAGVTVTPTTTFASGATLNLQNGAFTNTAANLVMSSGSNLFRDNGSLGATPSTYTGVNLTYSNLGFNQSALTTGNEFPASFTGNVVVNHTGATISLDGTKSLTGPLTLTAGILDASASNYNLSLTGNWTNNASASAFTPRSGTVTMNGTSAQALAGSFGTNFNVLTINNAAGVTVTPVTTFVSGATLNLQNGTFTNTAANLVMNSGANVQRDNGLMAVTPTTYAGINLTYSNLGFDQLTLTTANEFPAAFTGNVTVNHSGATISLQNAKALTGNITLTNGVLDATASNFNIALTGNWTNNAAASAFVPRSGTVTMNGTSAQALAGSFGTNFNVLTINNAAGVTLTPTTTFVSGATLNLQNGSFTNTAANLVMNSGSNVFRDNGSLGATPTTYSGINLTYSNLGFNQSALTTANEFPASFTGNVVVNHSGATISLNGNKALTGPVTLTSGSFDASASNYNISLTGDWTNNAAAAAFVPRSGTVTMNGTSAQSLTGSFGTNFNVLTINNAAGVTVVPTTTFVSGATLNLQNGTLTHTSTNLAMNSGSNVQRDNGLLTVTPAVYSGVNVTYANLGFNQTTLTTDVEFPASFTGNVTVNHTGATVSLQNAKTLTGSLTFTAGVLDVTAANYNVNITGNWTNNASAGAFVPRSATVTMNGTVNQALAGTFGTNFNVLTINNAAGVTLTPVTTFATGTTLNLRNGTFTNTPANLVMSSGTNVFVDNGNLSSSPATYAGVNLTYTNLGFHQTALTVGNEFPVLFNGVLVIDHLGSTISLNGNKSIIGPVTITNGTFDAAPGNFNLSLTGNWTNNSSATAFTARSGNVTINGSTPQTIGGSFSTSFNGLTMNNSTGATINIDETVNGTLTLNSGVISIGTNNFIFGTAAGAVAGLPSSSSMIIGNTGGQLRKLSTANGTFTFPIGDDLLNYTPITLNTTGSAYLPGAFTGVNVTRLKHPNNANVNNYLNRYWSVMTPGITSASCTATAVYVPSDVVGTEANISMGQYSGGLPWSKFLQANTVSHSISSAVTPVLITDFSGISTAAPTITSASNVVICVGNSVPLATTGVTGDPLLTYTWSPASGLSSTNAAAVVAAPLTTTTYTVTITDGNGFATKAFTTVSVNPLPAAIAGANVVCVGSSVTLNSSPAGTWSSTNTYSAVVGSASGIVTGMAAGNPAIVYTLPTGCSVGVTFTVNPLPVSIIGPSNVCAGSTITLNNATTGGTWVSSNTTLATVNSLSGVVSALVAGTPVMSYVLSATGCTRTASITVNALPLPKTIVGGGIRCANAPGLNISLNASQPGINYQLYNGASLAGFASGTGLLLNLGTLTAQGVYTVVATNVATGCVSNMPGSATITVNPIPSAYTLTGGGSLCVGDTGVHIFLSGSDTGTSYQLYNYSAPFGVAMAGTGAGLDFGRQTVAGVYTLTATYNFTNCPNSMVGIDTVIVNTLPSAYNITGGGDYCIGGTGVHIGVGTSDLGINYQLYNGSLAVGAAIPGASTSLDFGLQTAAGIYTIKGFNAATNCAMQMNGADTIRINPLPLVSNVTGGAHYCSGGTGVVIGLDTAVSGVNYQLFIGSTPIGAAAPGNGTVSYSFPMQTAAGTYSVVATDATTMCSTTMAGSAAVVIDPLPTPYTVGGGGSYCFGTGGSNVTLSGSDTGTSYDLMYLGSSLATVPGTGGAVSFGPQTLAGGYTVFATNIHTTCTDYMSGGTMVSIDPLPAAYAVTGGGHYCIGSAAPNINLAFSIVGTNYQLYRGSTPVGAPVAGALSGIDFGPVSPAGTYSIVATTTATGCVNPMANSIAVIIDTLPAAYPVTGGGSYCAGGFGRVIQLFSSDPGNTYQLYNGSAPVPTAMAGTGSTLNFGIQAAPGLYTIVATDNITSCVNTMTGATAITINPLPTDYPATGGGSYCVGGTGVVVGTSGSELGVKYQLYNGASAVGGLLAGNGSPLNFGLQTAAGAYHIVGMNLGTGCINNMSDSSLVIINPLPPVHNLTGGGGYCTGGAGSHVGLTGSDAGVKYQLYDGATAMGLPILGTGIALDFGLQLATGVYSVAATDAGSSCRSNMAGTSTVSLLPLPTAYPVLGGGHYCEGGTGVHIRLAGSATGIAYQLFSSGLPAGSAMSGTTASIDFGLVSTAGTYNVVAVNSLTGCTNTMTGSAAVSIDLAPAPYLVTGGGSYCSGGTGVNVGLQTSETGVDYRLYYSGTPSGSLVSGTGGSLSFGLHTLPGSYTVMGTNAATTCSGNMSGTATVAITPMVTPRVTVTSGLDSTVCAGSISTFLATPVNGGSAPVYQWLINGSNVGAGSTYSYVAANGDHVRAILTSSEACVTTPTATSGMTMTVIPYQAPTASIALFPDFTTCPGTPVTFTVTSTYGGPTPVYSWIKNGTVQGAATTYTYIPNNNDIVICMMGSSYRCRAADTIFSNDIVLSVDSPMVPKITISATPGFVITGKIDTFVATVTRGGSAPTYQWYLNGLVVPGATSDTYINTAVKNNDSVVCKATSTCGDLSGYQTVKVTVNPVGIRNVPSTAAINVSPNPNKGIFTIKGTLTSGGDDEVNLEMTDVLGQVVYKATVMAKGGVINEKVSLNNLAAGMYLLSLHSGADNRVFHVVIGE